MVCGPCLTHFRFFERLAFAFSKDHLKPTKKNVPKRLYAVHKALLPGFSQKVPTTDPPVLGQGDWFPLWCSPGGMPEKTACPLRMGRAGGTCEGALGGDWALHTLFSQQGRNV